SKTTSPTSGLVGGPGVPMCGITVGSPTFEQGVAFRQMNTAMGTGHHSLRLRIARCGIIGRQMLVTLFPHPPDHAEQGKQEQVFHAGLVEVKRRAKCPSWYGIRLNIGATLQRTAVRNISSDSVHLR